MKRRGFLASLLGLAATPIAGLLPARAALPVVPGVTTTFPIGWKTVHESVVLNSDWLVRFTSTHVIPRSTGETIKFRRYTPGTFK